MNWDLFLTLAAAVVSLPVTVVCFLRYCYALDELVNSKATSKATSVFCEHADTASVLEFFLRHFDRIFRPTRRFRPRFWRCVIFSLSTFLVIGALWVIVAVLVVPKTLQESLRLLFPLEGDWMSGPMGEYVLMVGLFVLLFNAFGDYLSLWETRYVLERLRRVQSTFSQVVFWTLDIAVTVILYHVIRLIVLLCTPLIIFVFYGRDPFEFFSRLTADNLVDLIIPSFGTLQTYFSFSGDLLLDVTSVCFYTTLSTTAWAGCSILVTRLWVTVRFARGLLNTQRYPFGSLTAAVLVLVLAVLCVILFVSLLVSRLSGASPS